MPIFVPTQEARPAPLRTGGAPAQRSGGFGEAAAEGVQQFAAAQHEVIVQQQRQRNADRIFRAEAQLQDAYREFEQQARQRTGQNAWGVTDDAVAWWDENTSRFVDALENDAQRQMFEERATQLRNQSLDSLSRFESEQHRVSVEESGRSAIANTIDFASSNFQNPDAVVGAQKDIQDRVNALANLNGWSTERRDAELRAHTTKLHTEVLQNMVDSDPRAAREYFEEHKDEIAGPDHDSLQGLIEQGAMAATAQEATDTIFAEDLSRREALAKARREYEGDTRDEVVRRLKTRFDEIDALDAQNQREAADQAWQIMSDTGDFSSIPPSLRNRLDGQTLQALRESHQHPANLVQTDWQRYNELTSMARENPTEFAQIDLRKDYGRLNIEERQALQSMQQDIQGGMQADVATINQQLGEAEDMMGWSNAEDSEKIGQFERRVRQAVSAAQRQKGGELNYEERQRVIDRMLVQGEVQGGSLFGMMDANRRFFEVAGTEEEQDFTPTVPDDERFRIEQALEANDMPVTDENVLRMYKRKLGLR